jgi:threonine dehydratase
VRGKDYDEAEEYARILAAEKGVFVSAYNDRHVIAGQSSMLIEILQHINSDFTMVAPVGGGGLISGLALAACSASQEIKVIGVESAASMAVSATVRAKRLVRVHVSQTIADGLAGNLGPYSMTPDIISFAGTELRSVTENEIYRAMRELANLGVYAEGSAAVGLAAVLNGAVSSEKPIIVAITGRNITVESFTKAFVGA